MCSTQKHTRWTWHHCTAVVVRSLVMTSLLVQWWTTFNYWLHCTTRILPHQVTTTTHSYTTTTLPWDITTTTLEIFVLAVTLIEQLSSLLTNFQQLRYIISVFVGCTTNLLGSSYNLSAVQHKLITVYWLAALTLLTDYWVRGSRRSRINNTDGYQPAQLQQSCSTRGNINNNIIIRLLLLK